MVESSNQPDSLDANIAFRLTAIRETFEESGVFLAQYHSNPADEGAMSEWCSRVRKDPTNFFEMCQQLNASPGVIYMCCTYIVIFFFLTFLSICQFVKPWDW